MIRERGRYKKDNKNKTNYALGLERVINKTIITFFINHIHFFTESLAKYSRVHFIFEGRNRKAVKRRNEAI